MASTYSDTMDNGGDVSPWQSMITQALDIGGNIAGQALGNSKKRITATTGSGSASAPSWTTWAMIGGGIIGVGLVIWLIVRE